MKRKEEDLEEQRYNRAKAKQLIYNRKHIVPFICHKVDQQVQCAY